MMLMGKKSLHIEVLNKEHILCLVTVIKYLQGHSSPQMLATVALDVQYINLVSRHFME